MDEQVIMEVPYFQVPNEVFEIGLTKFEMLVYMYLARTGNNGGTSFPSYKTIASKCDISRRKAIDSVKSLEEKGIIRKRKRYNPELEKNHSNIYYVEHDLSLFGGSAHDAPPSAQGAPIRRTTEEEPINSFTPSFQDGDLIQAYLEEYYQHFGHQHRRMTQPIEIRDATEDEVRDAALLFFEEYGTGSEKENKAKCSIDNFVHHFERYRREV